MKRAILISVRPEWVKKILNGEKTIEIRKTMPKCELPIDVYIYCTHGKRGLYVPTIIEKPFAILDTGFVWLPKDKYAFKEMKPIDGKVVAKFTLAQYDEFVNGFNTLERYYGGVDEECTYEEVLKQACLTNEEAERYAPDQSFYTWFISDLEIFDEPKGLSEFRILPRNSTDFLGFGMVALEKAPLDWRYVYVESEE